MFEDYVVVNLTPHPVRIIGEDGQVSKEWESQGSVRIKYEFDPVVDGIRVAKVSGIEGLEAAMEVRPALKRSGREYMGGADIVIVSRAAALVLASGFVDLAPGTRFVYPDGEVRDPDGRIIGCRFLTEIEAS